MGSFVVTVRIIVKKVVVQRLADAVIPSSVEVSQPTRPHDAVHTCVTVGKASYIHRKIENAAIKRVKTRRKLF